MLLSGFTFIRNARKYDFPIRECIESMLPIVDELVVNIGKSEDDTEELISTIQSPKIRVIRSVWDDTKVANGLVLSEQTNLALDACKGKWALYLQADEALHETELSYIRQAVEQEEMQMRPADALSFRYLHFYSGYTLVQRPWNWYPNEIRIVRRASAARSFGDAQTFRGPAGHELNTKLIDAHVYHYGHARDPGVMARKIKYFHRFWHGDQHRIKTKQAYTIDLHNLVWFWGEHPLVYQERALAGMAWSATPQKLIARKFDLVVIYATRDPEQVRLAESLQAIVHAQSPSTQVRIAYGLSGWLATVARKALSRKKFALVDLNAEHHSKFDLMLLVPDALCFFKWRVAHVPSGKLSGFRARLYSVINWGTHESVAEGFHVPMAAYPAQLARWLGINA